MNNLDSKIFIKGGKLGQESKNILGEFIRQCSDGWFDLSIKRRLKKASKQQFGYLFGYVFKEYATAFRNAGWDCKDEKQAEKIAMQQFACENIINKNTGEAIPIPLEKKRFSTVDMVIFVDSVRDFASENLNHYIPDPDPSWSINKKRLLKEQQQLKQDILKCSNVEDLDILFEKVYELGLEKEFADKYDELNEK